MANFHGAYVKLGHIDSLDFFIRYSEKRLCNCHKISKWYDDPVFCYHQVGICNFAMSKQGPRDYFHLHARASPNAVPECVDERIRDNDWAARVLFVQHAREQGEWCSQNPNVARVLDEQHPSRPVIIHIITQSLQIRDIFTEIHAAYLSLNRCRSRLVLGNPVSIVTPSVPHLYLNKCNSTDYTK